MHLTFLRVAGALAIICGALELYQTIAGTARIQHGGGGAVYVVPFFIAAGGILLAIDRLLLGIGFVLVGLGIQHFMVEITPSHYVAVIAGIASILLGIHVLRSRDQAAIAQEDRMARTGAS